MMGGLNLLRPWIAVGVGEYQNKVKPKFSILKGNTFPVPIQAGFLITVLLDRSHPFQIQIFKAQHNRW